MLIIVYYLARFLLMTDWLHTDRGCRRRSVSVICLSCSKHSIRIIPLFTVICARLSIDVSTRYCPSVLYFDRSCVNFDGTISNARSLSRMIHWCVIVLIRDTQCVARVYRARKLVFVRRGQLKRCVEMSVCNASALLLVNRLHRVADATRETNLLANKNRYLSGIGELVIETRILRGVFEAAKNKSTIFNNISSIYVENKSINILNVSKTMCQLQCQKTASLNGPWIKNNFVNKIIEAIAVCILDVSFRTAWEINCNYVIGT